jgi:hypothetical protein
VGTEEIGGIRELLPLFQGLTYFRVPAEFVRYPRTGHGILEPALKLDSARRNLAWFGYWTLGLPVPRLVQKFGNTPLARQPRDCSAIPPG